MLNPEYLAFLRTLPCFICSHGSYRMFAGAPGLLLIQTTITEGPPYGRQKSDTEAAHIGLSGKTRGMSQKCNDDEAIPLCGLEHHREGEFSIHRIGPAAFFEHHGSDRDSTIRLFQRLFEEHCR